MPVGDIYVVSNEFEYQDNANAYSFYLRVTAEANPNLVGSQLLDFGVARQTAWLPLHQVLVTFRCVTARQVYPTNSLPQLRITDVTGSRSCFPSLAGLPGQCCAVATLYGDIANPTANNRGRDFITGMCCSDQINGVIDVDGGGYGGDLCLMYVTMSSSYTAGGNEYEIGIYSPTRAKPPMWPVTPSVVPFFWRLQHVRVRSLIRTQRRRQPQDPCEAVCDNAIPAVPSPA